MGNEVIASIDTIKNFCDAVTAAIPSITLMISQVIATCSTIAAFWSKPKNGGLLAQTYDVVNMLAFNFNKAKNAR